MRTDAAGIPMTVTGELHWATTKLMETAYAHDIAERTVMNGQHHIALGIQRAVEVQSWFHAIHLLGMMENHLLQDGGEMLPLVEELRRLVEDVQRLVISQLR